jgi:hypothetical protein
MMYGEITIQLHIATVLMGIAEIIVSKARTNDNSRLNVFIFTSILSC